MKLYKLVSTVFFLGLPFQSIAAVDCIGVPSAVKMGEYGNQESYIIATVNGLDYRLGKPDQDSAKVRLSIAQSALMAGKKIRMRFWSKTSCADASRERLLPNSLQVII